jgi:hypothetical protein
MIFHIVEYLAHSSVWLGILGGVDYSAHHRYNAYTPN